MRASLEERARETRPYVDRLLHDEDLRGHIQGAVRSARSVLDELRGPAAPTALGAAGRLATDKDLQKQVREMVAELREARERLQGRKSHTFRNVALFGAGVAAALWLFRRQQDDFYAGDNGR